TMSRSHRLARERQATRAAWVLFGGLLAAGLAPAVGPLPARPSAAEVKRLVRRLGSPDFAEREAAGKRLEALGEPALRALRKAEAGEDPEVRRRAGRLARAIERRLSGEVWLFAGHTGPVYGVDFSRDGRTAVSCGDDCTVRLWDVRAGHERRRFDVAAEDRYP